jgi:hypothetical protein
VLMAKAWDDLAPDSLNGARRPDWLTAGFATLLLVGLLTAAVPFWIRYSSLEKLAQKKIHPAVLPLLAPSLLYTGLILAAIGLLGRNLSSRWRPSAVTSAATFALLALTVPMLAVRWMGPLRVYAATASSRGLAQQILHSPQAALPVYGYYYFRTGLPFYLRRPVGLVTGDGDELTSNYVVARWPHWRASGGAYGSSTAGGAGRDGLQSAPLVELSEFQSTAKQASKGLLVLVRNNEVPELSHAVGTIDPLWNAWDYSIWEVPPSTH